MLETTLLWSKRVMKVIIIISRLLNLLSRKRNHSKSRPRKERKYKIRRKIRIDNKRKITLIKVILNHNLKEDNQLNNHNNSKLNRNINKSHLNVNKLYSNSYLEISVDDYDEGFEFDLNNMDPQMAQQYIEQMK